MSGRSSPVNGGYESARLTVRKDLFPDIHLSKLAPGASTSPDFDDEAISCVKLETDFEQSIDEIAIQKQQIANGMMSSPSRSRRRKHKSKRDSERSAINGYIPSERKHKKRSHHRTRRNSTQVQKVLSGKNLNLVSSSECQVDSDEDEEEVELEVEEEAEEEEAAQSSSDDEVLKYSVKLPFINKPRQSGKPYSHELSQLSTKKRKKVKERRSYAIIPCSGKPRSMMDISRSSRSKKKSKKSETVIMPEPVSVPMPLPTYRSQIVDTHTMKIKIKRTSGRDTFQVAPLTPPPTLSISDLGQRKSKKKRAASPVASDSSGEEYDPSKGETAAVMSVAAPKSRHARPKTKKPNNNKSNNSKSKDKSEKTERNRISAAESKDAGPQSPWACMPNEILLKIFDYVVASQGSLPSLTRLGRVCKQWHSVSCSPQLWKHVDLAQYTTEKCKTDYKLVWLLENRLSQCQTLNIAQWKVCNVTWVLACVADYCPSLVELSVAGWSRITPEQLFDLLQGLPQLQRIDLSLTSETGGSSTCLSAASMARVAENFGSRLTHLTLANNKFTALPQILSSVAAHCQNLEVLDISGALATSHPAAVPLEALQKGCPKMRVFRAANSQLVLASATTSQQMESEGWSQLEELSIAGEAATELIGEYKLGDDALARLVRGATRLRLLDLRGLQRLTDSGLVRVPAWDLQHLFLGGCNVTRRSNACLELICEKWSHSLIELDLSWASATRPLDDAVAALADSPTSRLKTLNLCGSSVSLEPVKKLLLKCTKIESINLSSCRALPRGMKRLYTGKELQDLKDGLDPEKAKAKEEEKEAKGKTKKDNDAKEMEADSKSDSKESSSSRTPDTESKTESKSQDESSSFLFQEPKSVPSSGPNEKSTASESPLKASPDSKSSELPSGKDVPANPIPEGRRSTRDATPKLLSPLSQSNPDSSSTPRSDPVKTDHGSPHFSPVSKPDSQVQNSPDVSSETIKSNSWNKGHFKTTPTHKSEASPLNRLDSKLKHGKVIEQCSPTTSLENKRSPEVIKQDIKNPNSWNYDNYSPMPRQEGQFTAQRSPYSAQPSPAQPSPYSAQPSPYSAQPSPYSSQPSPYSAQPSPDTSQIVKPELQKSGAWNSDNFSPLRKHHQPFSPYPSTHTSPDPGIGMKPDVVRSTPNRTPGQYSPMSRQDRIHQSPYSPRPSVDPVAHANKKSPGMGNFSPMMRAECHLPSPEAGGRVAMSSRVQDVYGRAVSKASEMLQSPGPLPEMASQWSVERFRGTGGAATSSIDALGWAVSSLCGDPTPADSLPGAGMLTTPPPQPHWPPLPALPPFGNSARRPDDDISDPWTIGQYREEPPQQVHDSFVEQSISFESLRTHVEHQIHSLPSYLEDGFTETSRVD